MIKVIFKTDDSSAQLLIRLALGIVIFPHGAQKVFGWFGGAGFEKTIEMFASGAHFPAWLTMLLMAIELLGSLGLIFGFFTRISAFGIGTAMAVCAYGNHIKNGFFMNWFGTQKGEGFEFHILVIGIAIALIVKGGGYLSLDKFLFRNR